MRPLLLAIPAGLLCTLPATADDMPQRRAGLWEIKMTVGGREMPGRAMQQCTDADTDQMMSTSFGGAMGNDCAKPKIARSGSTITVDSTCKIAGITSTTRAVFSGDFNSAYTVAVTSQSAASGSSQVTMEAKWLGPCRDGQKPGDMVMPGGFKLNIRSLAPPARP